MPTFFKNSTEIAQKTETSEAPSKDLKSLDETKEGSQMHTLTGSDPETNQSVVDETSSPKNLAEDKDFIAISADADKQLDDEAQVLITKIEKYLSQLSGKTKTDHATYILQELQGLRFDPTCDSPHDPAVYGRVADKIEKYADTEFAAALKTTVGLYTESEDAFVLPKIFGTFPKILQNPASLELKQENLSTPAPASSSMRPK